MTRPLHPSCTVLVIDDEPSIVRALARLLGRHGAIVDTAANDHGALALLQERHYDVILCDLPLPARDGPRFYALLTREDPALRQRVIFLTGDILCADSRAFLEQCGQPWLAKPCTIAAVRSAIQHLLQAARAQQPGSAS